MTTAPTVEQRRFGMHANLLYDVITKQAGSLEKAILEAVMNGVDAGATEMDITLDDSKLTIADDGRGFKDRSEIERFFETFGTPHEEGDAVYGRYRMGRGQLFAFGRNVWRTNVFRMAVDIKAEGLDYHLEVLPEAVQGCAIGIELYKKLLPSERDAIEREMRTWIAYVSIPIRLNGKRLSADPSEAKWNHETDEAWFRLESSKTTLTIYNLGVYVHAVSSSRYGSGGVIVSKKRLDVNFARNDVQSDCPVFSKIKTELRKFSNDTVVQKKRMNDYERQHVAERILSGTMPFDEAMGMNVVTDIEGRHVMLEMLGRWPSQSSDVVVSPRGSRMAIKIAQQRLAIVLADETIQRFGVADAAELKERLTEVANAWSAGTDRYQRGGDYWRINGFRDQIAKLNPVDIETFSGVISDSYEAILPKHLKPAQREFVAILSDASWSLSRKIGKTPRVISAGHSDVADAWTDGIRNIWINAEKLKLLSDGYNGAVRLAALLLHEYQHDGPDTNTHEHDLDFYERYHNMAIDSNVLGDTAAAMMQTMARRARARERKPHRLVALFEDNEARIVMEGGTGSGEADLPPVDALETA